MSFLHWQTPNLQMLTWKEREGENPYPRASEREGAGRITAPSNSSFLPQDLHLLAPLPGTCFDLPDSYSPFNLSASGLPGGT